MGAWGPGIYQDDVALDIKDEYIELLKKGKTTEEAFKELINNNADYLEDEDAVPMLLALADTQWKYGRLNDMVKSDALNIINSGAGLEAWKYDEKLLKKRTEVLEKLKEKLESPQPDEKKVRPYKFFDCGWKKNDVFAYQLKSEYAKKYGLYDYWIIIIVCRVDSFREEYTIPIVRTKITRDTELPKTEKDINELDYIQVSNENYEHAFNRPGDFIEAEIKYNNSMKNLLLEYDFLPIYYLEIYNSSKRALPKSLIYIGNMPKILVPKIEYIPFNNDFVCGVFWKCFEKFMIDNFVGYNIKGKNYRWGDDKS